MPDASARLAAPNATNIVALARNLDVVALLAAAPVFLGAGLPLSGYAAAAAGWLVQRAVQVLLERRAKAAAHARTAAGWTAASLLVRPWIVAAAILVVGVGNREAGLSAAVLAAILFTIHLGMAFVTRALEGPGGAAR